MMILLNFLVHPPDADPLVAEKIKTLLVIL